MEGEINKITTINIGIGETYIVNPRLKGGTAAPSPDMMSCPPFHDSPPVNPSGVNSSDDDDVTPRAFVFGYFLSLCDRPVSRSLVSVLRYFPSLLSTGENKFVVLMMLRHAFQMSQNDLVGYFFFSPPLLS